MQSNDLHYVLRNILQVHFVKDCGVDNVCQSNLAVFGNLQLDV